MSRNIIGLRRASIQIEEVTIHGKKPVETIIGVDKIRPHGISFNIGNRTTFGWSLYFPHCEPSIVRSFGVHILKITNSNIKLNVRFLEPDTTFKTRGFDILPNETVSDSLKKGWSQVLLNNFFRIPESGLIVKFYFTGMEPNDTITVSGTSNIADYIWMGSLDYTLDFSLKIGQRNFKPAVKLRVLK